MVPELAVVAIAAAAFAGGALFAVTLGLVIMHRWFG